MSRECSEEVFLQDVARHRLTVLRDDGIYRHLAFSRPGDGNMRFDVVTWPGYLAYSGDMGCYVFHRLDDMLRFFRGDAAGELKINPQYWSEKVEARDRDGITEYDPEVFRARMHEWIAELKESDVDLPECLKHEGLSAAIAEIESELIPQADDGECRVRDAVDAFNCQGIRFSDFWEVDLSSYTFRFIWCCYALVWGIRLYDQQRAASVPSPTTEASHGS